MWGKVMFPLAAATAVAASAVAASGFLFASLEALQALNLEQAAAWLNVMCWTVDFIISVIYYVMMSVIGVLTDNPGCQIQDSNKLHRIAQGCAKYKCNHVALRINCDSRLVAFVREQYLALTQMKIWTKRNEGEGAKRETAHRADKAKDTLGRSAPIKKE